MASMSLVPERNVWAIFTTASSGSGPCRNSSEFSPRQPLGGVGLQVHRGVDEQFASFVVVGNLVGRLAQHVEEEPTGCRTTSGV